MAVAPYFSRKNAVTAWVLGACAMIGAGYGWYALDQAQQQLEREEARRSARPDVAFILPPGPPSKEDSAELQLDPLDLRIWELAARQPAALPERKEPLTPPAWKIVGVTTVGNEKNLLLLFENQTAAEIKKVGDRLPGGAKIMDISQEHVRLLLNGQYLKLSLYKQ